ncbi:MAG TPA: hypothetical protein VGD24_09775 [Gallionella sp.]
MRLLKPALIFFMAFALIGCAATKQSKVSAKNHRAPVLIGPIANIKGDKIANQQKTKISDLDVEAESYSSFSSSTNGYSSSWGNAEHERKFDEYLRKNASDPAGETVIEEVTVSSYYLFAPGKTTESAWTGMSGANYKVSKSKKGVTHE